MIHSVPCCCDPAPELATGLAHSSVIFSTSGTPSSGSLRTRAYKRTDVGTAIFTSTNYVIYDADRLGNMYSVVFTARTSVAKLDDTASTIWTQSRNASALYTRLCVNRNFDVFTVQFQGSPNITYVEKLDSSGAQQWITTVAGSGVALQHIACDTEGNCFASGAQLLAGSYGNAWGAYFDSSGSELWSIDGLTLAGGGATEANAARQSQFNTTPAFDSQGNVIVACSSKLSGPGVLGDFTNTIFKFDPDGNEIWRKVVSPSTPTGDSVSGLAIDGADNLYVAYNGRDSGGNVVGLGIRRYNGPDQSTVAWDFELSTGNNVGALALSKFGDLFVFTNPISGDNHHRILAADGTLLQSEPGAGSTSGNNGLVCYPGRYHNF